MPINENLLRLQRHRFLAVRGTSLLRRLLHHATEAGVPGWWALLVLDADGGWRGADLASAFLAADDDPDAMERPVSELPCLKQVECVERRDVTSAQAKDRARLSPSNLVVVTDGGALAGIVRETFRSSQSFEVPAGSGADEALGEGLLAHSGEDGRPVPGEGAESEERFTDIVCPQEVWCRTPRFAAILRLTCEPREHSAATARVWVDPGEVVVRIQPSGLRPLGPAEKRLRVPRGGDSGDAVFDLAPGEPGDQELSFDLFQRGHHLETIVVPVRVTAGKTAESAREAPPVGLGLAPDVAPPDRLLMVLRDRRSGVYRFLLVTDGGAEIREFQPVEEDARPEQIARGLFAEVLGTESPFLAVDRQVDDVDRRLESLGRSLWRRIIPEDLRHYYGERRQEWRDSSLLVVSDEPYIPWEMLWPYGEDWQDEEPWCLSLRMSRWLRRNGEGGGNGGAPGELPLRRLACLVPGDSGLPAARRERKLLERMLEDHALCDVSPPAATWRQVISCLENGGYDWLHSAAHGSFHPEQGKALGVLWLENGESLTPQHLAGPAIERHLREARPAFFLNACEAARSAWGFTGMAGWAYRLVSDGASMFLAPLWEVADNAALSMVEELYAQLLEGRTVSEACRQARLAARRSGDATWLAYSLYAHPNARLRQE